MKHWALSDHETILTGHSRHKAFLSPVVFRLADPHCEVVRVVSVAENYALAGGWTSQWNIVRCELKFWPMGGPSAEPCASSAEAETRSATASFAWLLLGSQAARSPTAQLAPSLPLMDLIWFNQDFDEFHFDKFVKAGCWLYFDEHCLGWEQISWWNHQHQETHDPSRALHRSLKIHYGQWWFLMVVANDINHDLLCGYDPS